MPSFRPLLLLILLSCCILSASNTMAAEAIKLGGTLGLTGKYGPMSRMVASGLQLWADEINQRGGLLGRPIKLIIRDDTSDPHTARKLIEELVIEEKVDLIFGPYSSVITTEIVKVTEKHGYSVLASGAASDQLWQQGYRHLFGVYIPASRYPLGFLKLLVRHGFERVAIVSANDMFSATVAEGAEKWAHRLGLTITLNEQFSKGTSDLRELALRIRESGAEAIVVGGHFNESVDMRRALQAIGWQPKAYYATLGPALQKYHDVLGEVADGTFTLSNWEADGVLYPGSQEFAKNFAERFGKKPSYQAAAGYASGQILEAAITAINSLDRRRLRDTRSSLDTMTILGRYGVDSTGQQIRHFSLVTQWQNGKLRVVGPQELKAVKSTPPIFP